VTALIAVSGAGAHSQPRLIGTVGFGQITLKTQTGRAVKRLKPGVYLVSAVDRSKTANFHLKGPRIDHKTGRSFEGVANWTVHFRKGTTIRYFSDRSKTLKGSFRVR
jgi:hypothetical protein